MFLIFKIFKIRNKNIFSDYTTRSVQFEDFSLSYCDKLMSLVWYK